MILIIFFPFFNFLLLAFFGRFLGKIGSIYLTFFNFLLLLSYIIKYFYLHLFFSNIYFINFGFWFLASSIMVDWFFIFDFMALSMLLMVTIVSFLVHLYSFNYMSTDPHFIRFISYLSLFTFFMFLLVSAGNLLQLFIGWEGVGICSFIIINFWYTRLQANKAAMKAMLMNRLGDIGFLIGTVYTFKIFGTIDFLTLSTIIPFWGELIPLFFEDFALEFLNNLYIPTTVTWFDIICLFFLIGVVGKSAQLGLHTWLPAAMEGPTPVSALIHAATMVTAGVFILIRLSFFFEFSEYLKIFLIILGSITAFISAFTAIFLYDIKKIIAYSTCSQLGYMVLSCGLSQYTLSFFHLINHAFFKALLFLTAGAIIHSFSNEQDIRLLSNLFFYMPFIYSCMLIGNIAIMGIPFLSGFYSKDLIIEYTILKNDFYQNFNFIVLIILLATICTSIYSMRLFYFLFLRNNTKNKWFIKTWFLIKQPFFILVALSILMFFSIFSGWFLTDIFSSSTYFLTHFKSEQFSGRYFFFSDLTELEEFKVNFVLNYVFFENEFISISLKLLPFFCNIFGILGIFVIILFFSETSFTWGWFLFYTLQLTIQYFVIKKKSIKNLLLLLVFSGIFRFVKLFNNNFYFNETYNFLTIYCFHYFYTKIFINFDKGLLEWIGPTGFSKLYYKFSQYCSKIFFLNLKYQLFIIFISIFFLLLLFLFI